MLARCLLSSLSMCCLATLACAQAAPATTEPAVASVSAPAPAEAQPQLVNYQFGLLRKGPVWSPEQTEATQKLQAAHLANIGRLAESGALIAAGPVEAAAGSDLRGIFVFKTASLEAARKLADTDPAIQARRLKIDLEPFLGTSGIGARYAEARAKGAVKDEMVSYQLVLMKDGPRFSPKEEQENAALAVARRTWMRGLADQSLVLSGPFVGSGPARGLLVFRLPTREEATAVLQGDPGVKTERLAFEVHTWWVAKGVLE